MTLVGYVDVHFFINVRLASGSRVYTGEVLISGEDLFEFEMEPSFSLREFRKVLNEATPDKRRELLRITIKKNGAEIPLEDNEYEVFFGLLFGHVYYLYRQTKKAKRAGLYLDGEQAASEGDGLIQLDPNFCKVLLDPKFGFRLLDAQVEQDVIVS